MNIRIDLGLFYTEFVQAVRHICYVAAVDVDDIPTLEALLFRDVAESLRIQYPASLTHYVASVEKHLQDFDCIREDTEKEVIMVKNRWIALTTAVNAHLLKEGLYDNKYWSIAARLDTTIIFEKYVPSGSDDSAD